MPDPRDRLKERLGALEEELARLKRELVAASASDGGEPLPLPVDVLLVCVAGHTLAFALAQVREVIPMVRVAPLPRSSVAVRGTINYRGRLVPVLDLHLALTGEPQACTPDHLLAVVEAGDRWFALTLDEAMGVRRLTAAEHEPGLVGPSLPDFVRGIFRIAGRPVTWLEPAGLLPAGDADDLAHLLAELEAAE